MTTRTLVLLRHAKAENPPGTADRERPLTDRGRADAAAAGVWLAEHGFTPDLVLCSPARRTRETWHGVAPALASAPEVRFDEELYAAAAPDLFEVVRAVDDSIATVLVIGHNPGLSQLSTLLDIAGDPRGLRTAGVAVHRLDALWVDWAADDAPTIAHHTARR